MTEFIGAPGNPASSKSDEDYLSEEDFRSLITGASIRDVRRKVNEDVIISLSASRQIIIPNIQDGVHIQFDIVNYDAWISPIPIVITRPTSSSFHVYAQVVNAIQVLYCIVLFVNTGRGDVLRNHSAQNDQLDIYHLLSAEDQIEFASSGGGSWYIDLIPKSKEAFKTLFLIATSVSERGRELLFRRLEAEVKMKEFAAEKERLIVESTQYAVRKDRANAIREQLKVAGNLIEFHKKYFSDREEDDVVRKIFEREFSLITGDRTALVRNNDSKA